MWGCSFELGSQTAYEQNGWTFRYGGSVSNVWAHQSIDALATEGQWSGVIAGGVNEDSIMTPSVLSGHRYMHWSLKLDALATGAVIHTRFDFYQGGVLQCRAVINPVTSKVDLYRGTTLVATSTNTITNLIGTHWMAVELLAQDAGGIFTVWIDGVEMVSFTGDTRDAGADGWDQFDMRLGYGSAGYVDDLIATTFAEGRLSETYCQVIRPSSDVTVAMTPSTGVSNYATIDEVPADTTDYNEGTTLLVSDRYGTGPALSSFATVHTVMAWAAVIRDGGITQARVGVARGASIDSGTYSSLPASWSVISEAYKEDPSTTSAWDDAGLAAADIVIQFN